MSQTDVCEKMGADMIRDAMTFVIHAVPPSGTVISATTIAVAKLKRSFATLKRVKFEHLSI